MGRKDSVVLGAVGDIGFYDAIGREMLEKGADWPFEQVREELARADLLFGNMESVAIPEEYPRDQIDPQGHASCVPGPVGAAGMKLYAEVILCFFD